MEKIFILGGLQGRCDYLFYVDRPLSWKILHGKLFEELEQSLFFLRGIFFDFVFHVL